MVYWLQLPVYGTLVIIILLLMCVDILNFGQDVVGCAIDITDYINVYVVYNIYGCTGFKVKSTLASTPNPTSLAKPHRVDTGIILPVCQY